MHVVRLAPCLCLYVRLYAYASAKSKMFSALRARRSGRGGIWLTEHFSILAVLLTSVSPIVCISAGLRQFAYQSTLDVRLPQKEFGFSSRTSRPQNGSMGILMCAGDKPAASIISLNRCSSVMPAGQPTHATSLSPGQRPEVAVSPPELQFTGEQAATPSSSRKVKKRLKNVF